MKRNIPAFISYTFIDVAVLIATFSTAGGDGANVSATKNRLIVEASKWGYKIGGNIYGHLSGHSGKCIYQK